MAEQKNQTSPLVLLADDDTDLLEIIGFMLKSYGLKLITARTGEETLKKVQQFHPDILILDIMMPRKHGFEVLKELQSFDEKVRPKTIICSSKSYGTEVTMAKELGAIDYLQKPFSSPELLNKIENLLGKKFVPSEILIKEEKIESEKKFPEPKEKVSAPEKVSTKLRLKLWGTRGSIPTSGPGMVKYGGNTSCLEIQEGEHTIIIDAGTGIRQLGMDLVKRKVSSIHLFISHTHWDHIQGFPFFSPAYVKSNVLHIYGPHGLRKNIAAIFRGQMDPEYFPVRLGEMAATMKFYHLQNASSKIGSVEIHWQFMNHPGITLGFRIQHRDRRIVYITDNELFTLKHWLKKGEWKLHKEDLNLVEFARGADLFICEAQYTDEEYKEKAGWGHSSISGVARIAALAGVKRWMLTHHDPFHDDDAIERHREEARRRILDLGGGDIVVENARDGYEEIF